MLLFPIQKFIGIARFFLLVVFIVTATGCASTGYLGHRLDDAKDIFTVQGGYGAGAKARVGPLQAGLLVDIGLGGLRGGEFLGPSDFWPGTDQPVKQDYVLGIFGMESFMGNKNSNTRGKSFGAKQFIVATPINTEKNPRFSEEARKRGFVYNPWPYYTQIECVIGLGLNIRLGFNPGELLDFVLGWTTIDIFRDDLIETIRVEAEQQ